MNAVVTTEQPINEGTALIQAIERAAINPAVDVEKMERLFALQERMMIRNAEVAFHAAFAEMQAEMPVITENGQIKVGEQIRSEYATLEDIVDTVRPILQKFGFGVSFRPSFPDASVIAVTAVLSHRQGHKETAEMRLPADNSGSKNGVQSIGSSVSYGKRYALCAILNITTRGEDDNGHTTGDPPSKGADPRPNGWKSQDSRKVTEYNNRILAAINEGRDVLELWDELKTDEVFATAVWATLPAPVKKFIREEQNKRK